MKKVKAFLAAGLFLFLGINFAQANHQIEGFWQSTKTNLVIEIDLTHNGIKVRKNNYASWRFYPEIFAADAYGDRFGKKFKIQNGNELFWIENTVIRADRFVKIGADDYWGANDTHDYFRQSVHSNTDNTYGYSMDGDWIARNGSRKILNIHVTSYGLDVRRNTSHRWSNYIQTNNRKFRDKHGNTIKIMDDDTIRWVSDCGTRIIYYDRVGRRGHRHGHSGRW